jgi:AraC-like DNA-binding protein
MKHIYTLTVIIAALLFSPAAWGQDDNYQAQKDSLWQAVKQSKGEEKILSYDRLANCYMEDISNELKIDTVLSLYDDMHKEAVRQNDFDNAGEALYNKLRVTMNSKMFDEVIKQAPDYMSFAKKCDRRIIYYKMYHIFLYAYIENGELDKAAQGAQQMYEQAKQANENAGMALMLDVMACGFDTQRRFSEAEEFYKESIRLLQKEESLRFLLLRTYSNLIDVFRNTRRNDEALIFTKELEAEMQPSDNTTAWVNLYLNYLFLYMILEEYDKVEYYCNKIEALTNDAYAMIITGEAWIMVYIDRKQYDKAMEMVDKMMELSKNGHAGDRNRIRSLKIEILTATNRPDEANEVFWEYIRENDSIYKVEFAAQFDELRTQYETDRHVAEKERNRNYFLFALAGVVFLLILVTVILLNRQKMHRKNKILVSKIKELQELQQIKENELLQKTTFQTPETDVADLCPETRKDKLCLKLRDLLLKEKIYRDEKLSRDSLTERLGINRYDLEDAFKHCFNKSYSEYVNELRLKDAVALLEQSDFLISEISEKVGFGTKRTFHRQFTAQYNMSPNNYRALARKT